MSAASDLARSIVSLVEERQSDAAPYRGIVVSTAGDLVRVRRAGETPDAASEAYARVEGASVLEAGDPVLCALVAGKPVVVGRVGGTGRATAAPSAVGTAGVSWLLAKRGATPAVQIGGIYDSAAQLGFVAADRATSGSQSPVAALVGHLEMDAAGDGVAVFAHANAIGAGRAVWGGNFIARNEAGATASKLVGIEVDVQPATGTTVSAESAGIIANAFTLDGVGPVLLSGGLGGGTWSNGIVIGAISAGGAAFAVASGAPTMASGLNLTQGGYSTAAAILGNAVDAPTLVVRQTSAASPTAGIFHVQNAGGTLSHLEVDAGGNTLFRAKASAALSVVYDATTAGQTAQFILRDGGVDAWTLAKDGGNAFGLWSNAAAGYVVQAGAGATRSLGFFGATPATQRAANPDTSGATLAALETEVNQLKALLRAYGLLAN